MKRALSLAALIRCFSLTSYAQDDGPRSERWHGLMLDQSTPDDAISALGKPAKDQLAPLHVDPLSSWITKILDNKLVSVMLDMKEGTVSPNGLSGIYGLEFQPVVGQMSLALSPAISSAIKVRFTRRPTRPCTT